MPEVVFRVFEAQAACVWLPEMRTVPFRVCASTSAWAMAFGANRPPMSWTQKSKMSSWLTLSKVPLTMAGADVVYGGGGGGPGLPSIFEGVGLVGPKPLRNGESM